MQQTSVSHATAVPAQSGADYTGPTTPEPFNRPPRIVLVPSQETVDIPKPPNKQSLPPPPSVITLIMPLIMVAMIFAIYIFINHASLQQLSFLLPMALFSIMGPVGTLLTTQQRARAIKRQNRLYERRFKKALAKLRVHLQELSKEQQRIALLTDPEPATLPEQIHERTRLWERRPTDPDFLAARVGKGKYPLSAKIKAPSVDITHPLWTEMQALKQEFSVIENMPRCIPLVKVKSLGITGRRQDVAALTRTLLSQVATQHSPEDVRIIGIYPNSQRQDWEWLRLLPHTAPLKGCTLDRLTAIGQDEATVLLNFLLEELSQRVTQRVETPQASALPHLIVLVHDYVEIRKHPALTNAFKMGEQLGVSIIYLVAQEQAIPSECRSILRLSNEGKLEFAVVGSPNDAFKEVQADLLELDHTFSIARLLSAIHIVSEEEEQAADIPTNIRFLDLIDLPYADHLDIEQWWSSPRFGRLRVPIGIGQNGPVWLDLNDAAHGPHGIIAGTTGAGKSELLQSIIVGLAITHHPHLVNFVLVDFKGGAAFKPFEKIPHVVGMVTDLSGKLTERALVALKSELRRREHILSQANAKKIAEYQAMQAQTPMMEPLPNLLIIIDEFAELAKEHPAFMEGLVSVVQKGRSLGVHLILATQKPTGSVNANIWSNLKFRICLRVASLQDSRDMLGRSEAALLPSTIPGRAYFQIGSEIFELFQSARVSLPARVANETALLTKQAGANEVIDQKILMDILEPYQATIGSRLFKPWPAPLRSRISLPEVSQEVRRLFPVNETTAGQPPYGWLTCPVGMVDLPLEQRQEPWMLNMLQGGGHVLIAGSTGSGKSVFLRTLITSLIQTHSPTQLHLYLVDFGGQALRVFESLPHVGGIFSETDADYRDRLLHKISGIIEERKQLCMTHQVDDFLAYQRRRIEQKTLSEMPAVLLVIDKFAEFRQSHEKEMELILSIARYGRIYGVYLVLTAERPLSISPQLLNLIEIRIGLRFVESTDSLLLLGKNDAARIDPGIPGRGYRRSKALEEVQIALPVKAEDDDEQAKQLEKLVANVGRASKSKKIQQAPPIRLLPEYVHLDYFLMDALTQAAKGNTSERSATEKQILRLRLGIEDFSLQATTLELHADTPHALITGGPGSGRTSVLQTCLMLLASPINRQARVVLIDFRRGCRSFRRLPNIWMYADNEERLVSTVSTLKEELRKRVAQLREESERLADDSDEGIGTSLTPIVIAIDDFEQLTNLLKNPLQDLKEFFLQARDLHLHLLITGLPTDLMRSDPLLQQVRGSRLGIVLGGDPNDPQVLGVRIGDLPPGRGYLVRRNQRSLVQVAHLAPQSVQAWIQRLEQSHALSLGETVEQQSLLVVK